MGHPEPAAAVRVRARWGCGGYFCPVPCSSWACVELFFRTCSLWLSCAAFWRSSCNPVSQSCPAPFPALSKAASLVANRGIGDYHRRPVTEPTARHPLGQDSAPTHCGRPRGKRGCGNDPASSVPRPRSLRESGAGLHKGLKETGAMRCVHCLQGGGGLTYTSKPNYIKFYDF